MINFLNLGDSIVDALRVMCLFISTTIYRLIIFCYELFIRLSTAEILSDSQVGAIYNKIWLLLSIYMIFKLTFIFLKMVVDPDKIDSKDAGAGKVITRAIIAVALLAFTQTIFDEAFELQRQVVESNFIAKIILPEAVTEDIYSSANKFAKYGADLSSNLFLSFYGIAEGEACASDQDLSALKTEIAYNYSFSNASNCIQDKAKGFDGYVIDFDPLLSIAVGGFVAWILITYCISLGLRVVKLAYLELIAPIPILSYISEKKDTAFEKWGKQCLSTYLDLFIRMSIIYFVVLLIQIVLSNGIDTGIFATSTNSASASNAMRVFLNVAIIMGLLMFAKQAPELLKELFPKGGAGAGDYGFSLKNREPLKRGLSAAAGLATGATIGFMGGRGVAGKIGGVLGGAFRGATGGITGKDSIMKNISSTARKQVASNRKYAGYRDAGSDFIGRTEARIQNALGRNTEYDNMENEAKAYETYAGYRKTVNDYADSNTYVEGYKNAYQNMTQMQGESDVAFAQRQQRAESTWKTARKAVIAASLGDTTAAERMIRSDTTLSVSGMLNGGVYDAGTDGRINTVNDQADRFAESNNEYEAFRDSSGATIRFTTNGQINSTSVNDVRDAAVALRASPEYSRAQANKAQSSK